MKKMFLNSAYGFLAAFVSLSILTGSAFSAGPWAAVAERIDNELRAGLKLYEEGRVQAAEEKAVDAYFGVFEGVNANMEIAIRQNLSAKRSNELEKGFSELRKAMHNKAAAPEVKARALDLADRVGKAAAELDKKGVGFNGGRN